MEKFSYINLAQANKMSERKLQIEIGKRAKYLKEELGMAKNDAANFIASLLSMGAAMNK